MYDRAQTLSILTEYHLIEVGRKLLAEALLALADGRGRGMPDIGNDIVAIAEIAEIRPIQLATSQVVFSACANANINVARRHAHRSASLRKAAAVALATDLKVAAGGSKRPAAYAEVRGAEVEVVARTGAERHRALA